MNETFALAIHLIPLLTAQEQIKLAECGMSVDIFQSLNYSKLLDFCPFVKETKVRKERLIAFNGKDIWALAEKTLLYLNKRQIHTVNIFQSHYPPLLREIYNPPFLLYYKGQLPDPNQPALAVIGTRAASLNAKNETKLFVSECAPSLGSIVSGLARGIDGVAHRTALQYKSHTTAILGSGFDYLYPPQNRPLASQILENGGVIISEYAPDTPPARYHFPERNRIVAGMSRGCIVIEAPLKSGALITAELALNNNRDVFVHHVGLQPNTGVSVLHENGALVVQRGVDVLSAWNLSKPHLPKIEKPMNINMQEQENGSKNKVYHLRQAVIQDLAQEIGWIDETL
jgi:DNA processing protein